MHLPCPWLAAETFQVRIIAVRDVVLGSRRLQQVNPPQVAVDVVSELSSLATNVQAGSTAVQTFADTVLKEESELNTTFINLILPGENVTLSQQPVFFVAEDPKPLAEW